MGGGLMQLVAYGSQDVYLTGNPQITFWKVVYRRYTNFAIESVAQTFNGNTNVGGSCVATISRNGDLIHKCYLQVEVSGDSPVNFGHDLIKDVELEIGGQTIDKLSGDWQRIWNELSLSDDKQEGYESMVSNSGTNKTYYIPLEFFFCQNPGLALPLIALQYHEVRIKFTLGSPTGVTSTAITPKLYVDYIYLDTDERRKMAQSSHEFLITQLQTDQTTISNSGSVFSHRLNFNHPVKELIWELNSGNSDFYKTNKVHLVLNGHDRFEARDSEYFTHVQPYQHHTRIPSDKNIHVYSFSMKPEDPVQPSGSCNFSRIDNAQLKLTPAHPGNLNIYATNWNVLRIMSGMGGLAYSN